MKKIVNNGEGSALMKNPVLIGQIVRRLRDTTELPLTVKIRLGWDSSSINAVEVAMIAAENGADAITVHGRTREQMYCPEVNINEIAAVKAAVDVPVIANGGIFTADDAMQMFDDTKCDGIMLGRGTMGNPWLFEEIAARIDGKQYVLPDIDVRLSEAMIQVEEMISDKGEHTGVLEARRHLSYYIKNTKDASSARHRLNFANTKEELYCIVNEFIKG
jgi:tRNA-dihydrouridine synthase B